MDFLNSLIDDSCADGYNFNHLDNIIFCFYNQQYWLFATESYLFSLYYLAIVSYVCRAYVLKKRGSLPAVNPNVRPIKNKLENPETKIIG